MSITTLEHQPDTGTVTLILSVDERAALMECESIIRNGRAVFVHVGNALERIRDSRLYRETHKTFEVYCLEVWEISDRFARSLRSAADVVGLLQEKNISPLPATESQARPLTKMPREEWAPAWQEVVATAPQGRITASLVAEVVQRRFDRLKGRPPISDTEILKRPTPVIVDGGTREDRILAAAAAAQAKLRELQDLIRTADGEAAANVSVAISHMDKLKDHVTRIEIMHSNRKAAA